jgi:zinc/manganese transport system permease protein
MRLVSVMFLAIVSLAVSGCAQIVGVLLVFTLMVGPAAAAQRLTTRLGRGLALAVVLALAEAWGGVTLAWWTDCPTSFWITALSSSVYLAACLPRPDNALALNRARPSPSPSMSTGPMHVGCISRFARTDRTSR